MSKTGRGKEGTLLQEAGELMWQALESRLLPVVIVEGLDRKREEPEKTSGAGRQLRQEGHVQSQWKDAEARARIKEQRRQPE